MSIPFLGVDVSLFPDTKFALKEPNGLLAAGGDLSTARLINAYQLGIFPWYEEFLEDGSPSPILWWCPTPRCVLYIKDLRVSRSLRKSIRNAGFEVSCDNAFSTTVDACAAERAKSTGTWINQDMKDAYYELHRAGFAHSIECWHQEVLVGGLYGVSIGNMFFGESMFSLKSDASKVALFYLCALLKEQGSQMIDCQISNPHLESLGAGEIDIEDFQNHLIQNCNKASLNFPKPKTKPSLFLQS
jgi:leucyl/phenylalanyl-tRNA--protein transferase